MRRVVVVGSGVAGASAALSAREANASVVMIAGGGGATSLGVGAVDALPWERATGEEPIDEQCSGLLSSFGCRDARGALLASASGILRRARGHDAALLDLAAVTPGRVLVVDAPGLDATSLAPSWSASEAARARGLSFAPLSAAVIKHTDERAMTPAEVASRHDDEARLSWLASVLKDALAREGACSAIVLPSWLGATEARATKLSEMVGVPCGEAIALASSPVGRRFEASRDRALALAEVFVRDGWVKRIALADGTVTLDLEDGAPITCDAVVLATGGLLGGGIVYTPSEAILATALPPYPRHVFACGIDAHVKVGVGGEELVVPGSMFGLSPEAIAWPFSRHPLMERVGILAEGARASDCLFVAGDVVADQPRTWLSAMTGGVIAGRAAATS